MDRDTKKAILKNRARILNLDYFDLTAPLLASETLSLRKHKEIKVDASEGKARIDLLLEWIDDCAPMHAFGPFLQGIRNCKDLILAKKIKREAAGETSITITNKAQGSKSSAPKIKLPKLKLKKEIKSEPGVVVGINIPNGTENIIGTPSNVTSKKKAPTDKTKKATPKLNGAQKTPDVTKVLGPRSAAPSAGAATPRSTRKSSVMTNTSLTEKLEEASESSSKKRKAPSAKATPSKKLKVEKTDSPKSRPKVETAAKNMTFAEVEKKQEDFRQKFKFRNFDSSVKTIHYNDKTDIFYQGCPTEMTKKICSKKVDLKGKEYVCEGKHHNTTYIHIPRLYVTFNDGTGDMQLVLFKKNVEIFAGKPTSDLDNMTDGEIKGILEKSMGRKLNVEVQCDKVKKQDVKKAGGAKWNNVATILDDSQGPKGGKKRKN